MADTKISALTSATTPLAGTEVLPIVQNSTTKKVSVANLTAGRVTEVSQLNLISGDTTAEILLKDTGTTNYYVRVKSRNNTMELVSGNGTTATLDASNNIKLEAGNLIQGTAAKGIDFSANTPAAGKTSTLLNWYEEGTWTPSVGGNATYTAQSGTYTRIGRYVTVVFDFTINAIGSGSTNTISGLPFSVGTGGAGTLMYFTGLISSVTYLTCVGSGNTVVLTGYASAATSATYPLSVLTSGTRLQMMFSYTV